jgi:hypothetical protein
MFGGPAVLRINPDDAGLFFERTSVAQARPVSGLSLTRGASALTRGPKVPTGRWGQRIDAGISDSGSVGLESAMIHAGRHEQTGRRWFFAITKRAA